MSKQSKLQSIIESCTNVFTGMFLAFGISQLGYVFQEEIRMYIWQGFTWEVSIGSNLIMTTVLTLVSVIRGYFWRRIFNELHGDKQ